MSRLIELIDAAKSKAGSYGRVAELLEINQTRISEWKKGKYKPGASQLAQLAEIAEWPVLETVAELETELNPQAAAVWQKALGKLRAAGVAATVMLGLVTSLAMTPSDSSASESTAFTRQGSQVRTLHRPPKRRLLRLVIQVAGAARRFLLGLVTDARIALSL